ncbi:MAG: hypothetical protein J0M29_12510 [Chitinophagales bacterium]|nr:hypothetical protein [Chitinophagales bacterium]
MKNTEILSNLEDQTSQIYRNLNQTSISALYKKQFQDIQSGMVAFFGIEKATLLEQLIKLADDSIDDNKLEQKLNDFRQLDHEKLIDYFKDEFERVFKQIADANKQDEIQALFIEYDYYYQYSSYIICCGKQNYPIIEVPRYISNEYDYNKEVYLVDDGVNFQLAWIDCKEFSEFKYLGIQSELEKLFQLQSRVLLHKALALLDEDKKLNLFKNIPFTIYINEHDCEVMMLYRIG